MSTSPQPWSLEVYVGRMVKDLMASPSLPGPGGSALAWDVTCWDSFAPSNIGLSSSQVGKVADTAGIRKRETYREIANCPYVQPIAFKTTGTFGQDAYYITFSYSYTQHNYISLEI